MGKNKEIGYYKHIFEKLVRNIQRYNNKYYLSNSRVIYENLLLSFSKIHNLLPILPLNPQFVQKFTEIYQCYTWILKKIDPETDQFLIPTISKLNQILKKLVPLINEVIPLLHFSAHSVNCGV